MKRILYMVLRNIILVPFMWIKLCYHESHVNKYTEEQHYKMLKFIVRRANKGGNMMCLQLWKHALSLFPSWRSRR